MARVVVGSYLVRYPLGGMMSWVLQYLVGLHRLGHDVWHVERSHGPDSCFDPSRGAMGDDCAFGARAVEELLAAHGLGGRWCYVDQQGAWHGAGRAAVLEVLRTADLFLDMGAHGAWTEETRGCRLRVLVDGEPGFTQAKMQAGRDAGRPYPQYDAWYTTGRNVGTGACLGPDGGVAWRPFFHPVVPDLFEPAPPPEGAPFTTVMNWRSYEAFRAGSEVLGHKDASFEAFLDLPRSVGATMELAVFGKNLPRERLAAAGWRLADAHAVTRSFDAFRSYIRASAGEFSVAKHGFVAARTGWFSDRSAAYLASGRPVVLQDTGFSAHLPCGEGLFAVAGVAEAAAAIESILSDPARHGRKAREVACEHLDAAKVLGGMLAELGLGATRPT